MKPTIGRIVTYTSLGSADGKYPPEPHPALITRVDAPEGPATPACVSLAIFYTTGLFFMDGVHEGEPGERGTWSWPVRSQPYSCAACRAGGRVWTVLRGGEESPVGAALRTRGDSVVEWSRTVAMALEDA